jgi:hypothetical protein
VNGGYDECIDRRHRTLDARPETGDMTFFYAGAARPRRRAARCTGGHGTEP